MLLIMNSFIPTPRPGRKATCDIQGGLEEGDQKRKRKTETGRCTKDGRNVAVWHEERCDKENPEICVELSGCFWLVPQEQTEEEGKRRMDAWRSERRMGVKEERERDPEE